MLHAAVDTQAGGLIGTSLLQDCKRHRPNGCEEAYARLRCPVCLILPCLVILQKISNHLELLKGKDEPVSKLLSSQCFDLPAIDERMYHDLASGPQCATCLLSCPRAREVYHPRRLP